VLATGGKPVLITPLTRRTFQDGKVNNDLAPWSEATKKVAAEEGVPVLDLNTDSLAFKPWDPRKPTRWRWFHLRNS
jgi:hypothetical protein